MPALGVDVSRESASLKLKCARFARWRRDAPHSSVHEPSRIGTRVKYDESRSRNDPLISSRGERNDVFQEGLGDQSLSHDSSNLVIFLPVNRARGRVESFLGTRVVRLTCRRDESFFLSARAWGSNKAATHRERTENEPSLFLFLDFATFRFDESHHRSINSARC